MKSKKNIFSLMENALFVISLITLIISLSLHISLGVMYEIFGLIKPITLVQYSGFLTFALFLSKLRCLFSKLDKKSLDLLVIVGFLFITGTLFETLWSFDYWFSTYSLDVAHGAAENTETLDSAYYLVSPDLTKYYLYKDMRLNTSAKKNVLLFMMSVYFVYFLHSFYTTRNEKV
jgi:hypothetical protein